MQAGIVGAGIMGRLLALALYNAGWQVTLFERNEHETSCSAAAAGLLTPVSELDTASLIIFRLGLDAIDTYWPRILQQLSKEIYFQKQGSIVLNHPSDRAEWNHFSQRIMHKLDKNLPQKSYYQLLSNERLIQLEPSLTKFETAYHFPMEAQIDSQAVLSELKQYLITHGVIWHANAHVLSIMPGKIIVNGLTATFDVVFDCRGLGARTTFSGLRAVRGELIWLYAPDVHIKRPIRLLHPRYRLYIVPRPNAGYLVGATEIEAEDYSAISVRTTLELLTASYYVHAGFAEARILKTVTHCRPTLPHHLPTIKATDGFIAVNGLYRHGYLIAPTLAEEILCYLKTSRQNLYYPELWETNHDHYLYQ